MFAQIRVQNINSRSGVQRLQIHNNREYDEHGFTPPANVLGDEKAGWNYGTHTTVPEKYEEEKINYNKMIDNRFEEVGVKPRKGAVIALEYVVGFSKEMMKGLQGTGANNYSLTATLDKQIEFLEKKHGAQNIIAKSYHFDESNPHAHVLVVPLVQKKTKWEERKEKETGIVLPASSRLCAKDYTGGPAKLSKLQDDFYKHCNDWTSSRLDLELTKHKKAEVGISYEKQTRPEISLFRDEIKRIELEVEQSREKLKKVQENDLKSLKEQIRVLEEKHALAISKLDRVEEVRDKVEKKEQEPKKVLNKVDLKNIKFHQKNKTESNKPFIPKAPNRNKGRGDGGMSM